MSDSYLQAGAVWLRPRRATRDTPSLTRERIVEEAVALLDEEGVGRLTMRRLAERLGTGSTTLYWHVTTKDDVLDLALDTIFGDVTLPAEHGPDWRADVVGVITGWRAAMLRHPWSTALLARPMIGPNVLARTEFLHAALVRAGFAGSRLTAAAYALGNYVIGSALAQAGWQLPDDGDARRAAQAHIEGQRDRYPTLAGHEFMHEHDWDATFDQGLNYLLDGMSAGGGPN